jgi:SSS family solute:Na+ symporter
MLTLLAAAMSTLSSQFHVMGTSIGRDFYQAVRGQTEPTARTVFIVRVAMLFGIAASVIVAYHIRGDIIARATALFFALCSTIFLPTFLGALFWKRMTTAGAVASMVVGGVVDIGWLLLVKEKEAGAVGLVQMLTGGKTSILAGYPNWPVVDSLVIALPASILTAVIVSLLTKPPAQSHLERCFAKGS